MLLLIAAGGGISAIADRIHDLRVRVENSGVCPLSPSFWTEWGGMYEDLYLEMMKVEDEVKRWNLIALIRAKGELEKVKYETEALEKTIRSLCSPFLTSSDQLYTKCSCPSGTCSGLFCMCTDNGSCWAIFGDKKETGYNPIEKDDLALNAVVYDVSGRVVSRGAFNESTLKPGIYFVKYADGDIRKIVVR